MAGASMPTGGTRRLWRPRSHLLPDTEGREDPVQNRIVGIDAQHTLEFPKGLAQIHQDRFDRYPALEPIRATVQRGLSSGQSFEDSKAGDDAPLVTVDGRSRVDPPGQALRHLGHARSGQRRASTVGRHPVIPGGGEIALVRDDQSWAPRGERQEFVVCRRDRPDLTASLGLDRAEELGRLGAFPDPGEDARRE